MSGRVTDETVQTFIEEFNKDRNPNSVDLLYGPRDRKHVRAALEAAAPHMMEGEVKSSTTGHCEFNKLPGGCPHHNLRCGYPKCDQRPAAAPPKADAVDLEQFREAVTIARQYAGFGERQLRLDRLLTLIDSSRSKP